MVGGARFSAGLEFGGKFGVPLIVTINKSARHGVQWNRNRHLKSVLALPTYKIFLNSSR